MQSKENLLIIVGYTIPNKSTKNDTSNLLSPNIKTSSFEVVRLSWSNSAHLSIIIWFLTVGEILAMTVLVFSNPSRTNDEHL